MVFDKIPSVIRKIKIFFNDPNDPVKNCIVHKTEGCAHVDGFLCDMKTCDILKIHKLNKAIEKEMNL